MDLSSTILEEALVQAKIGRMQYFRKMLATISEPRETIVKICTKNYKVLKLIRIKSVM